ncbi:EF-hand domain-containing protein [Acidipila sp. EB88]|uniref:EF-hand domain-containing protein n=1 Tax=Acidipila sp. EB88 TaxID=2305226 RepID=UPI0013159DAF|nr:EF-hand domain-containing protein [Acidipila sp. EB88]
MSQFVGFNRKSLVAVLALSACTAALAQRQQGRPRLVLEALDLDHDGSLSKQEIQAAPASLHALDRDQDGQLSLEELTPRRDDAGANPAQLVTQLMQFDKNADGVLTPDELPERMQSLFARADTNKDGKLTPDEIRQSAARTSAPRGRPSDPAETIDLLHLDPVVDALDIDHNGVISAEEIRTASLHLLVLDKNHDGILSADEMIVRQQSPAQRVAHILREFDTNEDGKLSLEEVPDGMRGRFADADKNKDGFLDASELQQMFASMPANGPRHDRDNNVAPATQPSKGQPD